MVAATFPNLSFENPPGTGPTLVSAAAEPFAFTDGQILSLQFAGVQEDVVLLASDFGDIGAATAAEVAALLEARVDDLGAADDGGFVRLTSLLTGEDISLEVLAGGANAELAFPAGAVNGETYEGGAPNGWNVLTDTDSVNEWAEWADENGRPEEIFDGDGWVTAMVSDSFSDAIFDAATLPAPFETFTGWSSTGLLLSFLAEAASFGAFNEAFEPFETGWGSPTYFAFPPPALLPVAPETFESSWGQGGPPSSSFSADTSFANGTKNAEDFEDVSPAFYVVQPITAAAGLWRITINGISHTYTATGGDSAADIALQLRTAINTGSTGVGSSVVGSILSLWPTDPDADLFIVVAPPSGGTVDTVTARDYPLLAEEWVGQDLNPDFD